MRNSGKLYAKPLVWHPHVHAIAQLSHRTFILMSCPSALSFWFIPQPEKSGQPLSPTPEILGIQYALLP